MFRDMYERGDSGENDRRAPHGELLMIAAPAAENATIGRSI
jgi:hypothetical protein